MDGASSDGTLGAIERHHHTRMRMTSEPDAGIYDALNKGIQRASGDVIGVLHSDDLFADDRVIERVAQRFDSGDLDCVYSDLDYVSSKDSQTVVRHWKAGVFKPSKLRYGWMPPHPTLFVRRAALERYGPYDTDYRIAADYKLMLKLFKTEGIKVAYIPEVLVRMRLGGASNQSLRHLLRKSSEDYRALRQTNTGGAITLAFKNARKIGQFLRR